MKGEIVSTQTEDKVRLHGLYCEPIVPPKTEFDSVILTHGLAGNFYSSRFLTYLSHTFLELGINVVIGNTRGHDDVNRTVRMGKSLYLGAAFEKVSDCRFDLEGWVEWLKGRGNSRVLLAGHSLGAIKSLYAHAHRPHDAVLGLIGLSATRLNYERLLESTGKELFAKTMNEAQAFVDAGDPDRIIAY